MSVTIGDTFGSDDGLVIWVPAEGCTRNQAKYLLAEYAGCLYTDIRCRKVMGSLGDPPDGWDGPWLTIDEMGDLGFWELTTVNG